MEGATFNHCLIPELVLNQYVYNTVQQPHAPTSSTSSGAEGIEDITFEEVSVYCRYVDVEAITKNGIRKPADVQQELEQKCQEDANTFVTYLREQIKYRNINFHGDSIAKIFDNLHADLPMMRKYSINNFYTYFRDQPL